MVHALQVRHAGGACVAGEAGRWCMRCGRGRQIVLSMQAVQWRKRCI